jgi:hypothetical protein
VSPRNAEIPQGEIRVARAADRQDGVSDLEPRTEIVPVNDFEDKRGLRHRFLLPAVWER